MADDTTVPSVLEQYEDAAYSTFVESPSNSLLYSGYIHHSLFHVLRPFIESKGRNKRVLDLGCGNAIIGRKIRKMNPEISVVGVDISQSMLNKASQLIELENLSDGFELLNCDVADIPSSIGQFDCIVSGFLLAHMSSRDDLFSYFRQVALYLKPGGITCNIIPRVNDLVEDGTHIKAMLPLTDDDGNSKGVIELYDYKWSERTYRYAAQSAGLLDVSIQAGAISPLGRREGLAEPLEIEVFLVVAKKDISG